MASLQFMTRRERGFKEIRALIMRNGEAIALLEIAKVSGIANDLNRID